MKISRPIFILALTLSSTPTIASVEFECHRYLLSGNHLLQGKISGNRAQVWIGTEVNNVRKWQASAKLQHTGNDEDYSEFLGKDLKGHPIQLSLPKIFVKSPHKIPKFIGYVDQNTKVPELPGSSAFSCSLIQ